MAVTTAGEIQRSWRALPIGTLDDIIGAGTCLILAPHPDDESLGCGGLIASCCAASRPPVVVILTDGSASHPGSRLYPPAKLIALREREVARALASLGLPLQQLMFLREPDSAAPNAGPAFDSIVGRLASWVRDFSCTAILGPWHLDPHCDHEAASRIAAETARITGVRLLSYPIWGWTLPDDTSIDEPEVRGWRLDVTPHLEAKQRAIAAHASQFGHLVTDVPYGFQLPMNLLRAVEGRWETFVLP